MQPGKIKGTQQVICTQQDERTADIQGSVRVGIGSCLAEFLSHIPCGGMSQHFLDGDGRIRQPPR